MSEVLTADRYRELAKEAHQRKIESWDRSDTDGALSQWASGVSESEYLTWASLAENDFISTYTTLAKNGELVPCKEIETKFGLCYAVFESFEEANSHNGQIIQFVGKGDRAVKNKGFEKITVQAKSKVVLAGSNWTVFPIVVPVEKVFTPDNCEIC